jgi:hypothetical protein
MWTDRYRGTDRFLGRVVQHWDVFVIWMWFRLSPSAQLLRRARREALVRREALMNNSDFPTVPPNREIRQGDIPVPKQARELHPVGATDLAREHRRAMAAARRRVTLLLVVAIAVALVGWWIW